MKFQFDAQQPYELDAVVGMVDLFDGQKRRELTGNRGLTTVGLDALSCLD
jgi:hypothetical protein